MGCVPSSCLPKPAASSDVDASMHGLVFDELGRWKASIEILEREGRKELNRNAQGGKAGKKGNVLEEPGSQRRAGMLASYKDIKEMLLQGRSGSGSSTAPSESKLAAERRKRGKALQSLTSGEIMLSMEPAILRKKLLNPPNEGRRQQTVDALKIVQTSQDDPHYGNIVTLAAKIFNVPLASIGILDRKRIWLKAIYNTAIPDGSKEVTEIPRDKSFTAHMLLTEKQEVMIVEDALEDGRFHDIQVNHKSNNFPARFFAGVPLYAPNGFQIGALVISDDKPRKLDAGSFTLLTNLAEIALRGLLKDADYDPNDLPIPADEDSPPQTKGDELIRAESIRSLPAPNLQHKQSFESQSAQLHSRAADMDDTGIMVCDATAGSPTVLLVNSVWTKLTGVSSEEACRKSLWDLFKLDDETITSSTVAKAIELHAEMDSEADLLQGKQNHVKLSFRTASSKLDQYMPLVGVPSFIEFSQKRDLHYFFVLVKECAEKTPELSTPTTTGRTLADRKSSPMEAFVAASAEEPWGEVMEATSQEAAAAKEAALEALRKAEKPPDYKPTVSLPFNPEIFTSVLLGPLLGRGSYGRVHRGVWQDQQVAVKILDTFHQGLMTGQVEDLAEARLMESIVHPNIMQTYQHATRFKADCSPSTKMKYDNAIANQSGILLETWLLLEFCNKGSLQDANDRGWFRTEPSRAKGKPDMSIILPTALELAEGLEYLHDQGILHGDLSPGNVLLANDPSAPHGFTVKIADFGLSRSASSKTICTKTFGTVTHMPPELLSDGKLTKAADVYAFGVLLWSMYTGVPAWHGLRRTQVLFKVTAQKASLIIPPACPPFFKDILGRCMHREHGKRPKFADMVREFKELYKLEQQGVDMDTYALPTPVPPPAAGRWRSLSLGAKARPALPQVPEEKIPVILHCQTLGRDIGRRMPSLQRRPSFSQQGIELEVV